jgi:ATP-dependent DNA helicase RecQ
MLRGYGGAMFGQYVTLWEDKLCDLLRMTRLQLDRLMQQLVQMQLIHFIPQYDVPLVRFTNPRQLAPNFHIDMKMMAMRKAEDLAAIKSLEQLANDQEQCRQQLLVQFFNPDEQTSRCGICDNCQRQQRQQTPPAGQVKSQVLAAFQAPALPAAVVPLLAAELNLPLERIWDVVRLLQDQALLLPHVGGKLVSA